LLKNQTLKIAFLSSFVEPAPSDQSLRIFDQLLLFLKAEFSAFKNSRQNLKRFIPSTGSPTDALLRLHLGCRPYLNPSPN